MSGGISATTLATISIATAVVSAGVGAYSSIAAGQQAQQQAKYQAQVAKNNEIIAQQNADAALKQGDEQAAEQRQKTRALIGQQRASMAAQGGDINSGSDLDIQSDTAASGKLDELTIKNNALLQARQYQIQGNNFESDAQLATLAGKNAATNSYIGAGSSLLGAASSISNQWAGYKTPQALSSSTNYLGGGKT